MHTIFGKSYLTVYVCSSRMGLKVLEVFVLSVWFEIYPRGTNTTVRKISVVEEFGNVWHIFEGKKI